MKFLTPVAVSILALSACSKPDTVSVSGSSTVLPVVTKAADVYKAQTGRGIIVNSGGSGAGFSQLAQGLTEIGMMSRDITPSERAQYPDIQIKAIAIARDAVAPVVSSEIYDAGITVLSPSQIADIYRGRINNWAELGGPDRDILVVDKEASRGTRHIFMQAIMGEKEPEAKGADLVLGSNNEEQTALSQSDSAIGMLSIAWLNDDIKGLTLDMGDTRIMPTLEAAKAGQWPISRNLNVIVRSDITPAGRSFVDFLLSPAGQDQAESAGYIKVTP